MSNAAWLIGLLLGAWALIYHRGSLMTATLLGAAYLASWGFFSGPSAIFCITATIYGLVMLPLAIPPLRRVLISNRLLPVIRKAVPPMSQTEREALEAGTVGWDGELFSGNPDWGKLLTTPKPTLSDEEQAFLDGPTEELCRRLDDWRITHEDYDLPPEVWKFIRENGFFGMIIPKKYGGLGFSALAHSNVVMKIASRSTTAAVTVMVPNSLGPGELFLHYGTQAQKDHYLPRLARGDEIPCFALTGPEAGSDASSIPDKGVVCRGMHQGKEVIGIRLNWEKRYITLGPVATLLGLAFRLYDPDHLLGKKEDIGITLAVIPTNTPGIDIGNRHFPLNIPFQNGPNRGKDVFIPMEWVIGGAERVGQGWRMLMECLAAGRSISLPSLSTGAGKLVCRATGAYARIRKQFKTPIGKFEGVEEALARMAGYTYMMDAARTMTAGAVDLGEKPSVISAIVKYNLTERMRQVVNDAMDVQGGTGICMGPRNYVGRMYQAIPISITVEGANILTRSLIVFGQGAIRCHPYVLKEIQAVNDPDQRQASQRFDDALFGHIGFTLNNAARALWLGITRAHLVPVPVSAPVRRYYQHATRMSAAYALVADVAMLTIGAALKRKEKLSGRLADMLSQLYLISTVLKRYADQGQPEEDLPLVRWACEEALYTFQEKMEGLLRNLPARPVAWVLRRLVFPAGKPFAPPGDQLGHQAANLLLEPSAARDRLTAGIFVPQDMKEPLGRLEATLQHVIAAEAVEQKIRAALRDGRLTEKPQEQLLVHAIEQGVIMKHEAETLRHAHALRRDVITVDEFPPDYLKGQIHLKEAC